MFGLPPALAAQGHTMARKWITLATLAALWMPLRAAYRAMQNSIFFVNSGPRGINSWIFIEIVSLSVLYAFFNAPSPANGTRSFAPQSLLVGAYPIHLLNSALVSPLRAPSRSSTLDDFLCSNRKHE
ncbi:hypothetical protein C8R45DRAFT_1092187 [Mycena sanguinolenta]|nr:hypothetical protein C8R45DRAFT_1092187 [Mycena sanguinolenta]